LKRPVVLVVGGLDPSGGAGLAADIQAVTALGAHPAPVASLLTVQDTVRVLRAEPVAPRLVADAMRAVLADMPVAAVKLGALGSAAAGGAVAGVLRDYGGPVVTDPVLAASGGGALAEPALLDTYREQLLPLSTVATPNHGEFETLGGTGAVTGWIARGLGACLVTGGDREGGRVMHVLHDARGSRDVDAGPRHPGEFHGTGCTFASAIAARLALGDGLEAALAAAGEFVARTLDRAFRPGRGQALPGRW